MRSVSVSAQLPQDRARGCVARVTSASGTIPQSVARCLCFCEHSPGLELPISVGASVQREASTRAVEEDPQFLEGQQAPRLCRRAPPRLAIFVRRGITQAVEDIVRDLDALQASRIPFPVSYTHLTLPTNREV